MATIDVLIVIDADTILKTYGTNTNPEQPTQVSSQLIYMITEQSNALTGNAGNELTIKARTEDEIRWRETTLSLNALNTGILYRFVAYSGGSLISDPEPRVFTVTTPLPQQNDPLHPTTQTIKDYCWASDVESQGSVTYHFNFMIMDRDGKAQGYYWWDPFIQITS